MRDNQFGEDQPTFLHDMETSDFTEYFSFRHDPYKSISQYGIVVYTFSNTPEDVKVTVVESRIIFTHPLGAKEAFFVPIGVPSRVFTRQENGIIEVTFIPQILYS